MEPIMISEADREKLMAAVMTGEAAAIASAVFLINDIMLCIHRMISDGNLSNEKTTLALKEVTSQQHFPDIKEETEESLEAATVIPAEASDDAGVSLSVRRKRKGLRKPAKISSWNDNSQFESSLHYPITDSHHDEAEDSELRSSNNKVARQDENSDETLSCSHCAYIAKLPAGLRNHLWRKHGIADDGDKTGKKTKTSKCSECSYVARFRSDVLRHMKTHTKKKSSIASCDVDDCDFTTSSGRAMVQHKVTTHPNLCEKLSCDKCNFTTIKKSNLYQHMRTHLAAEEKPFKCNECSYSSANREGLKIHTNVVHKGLKPYLCDTCGKSFTGISMLSKHKLMKHKPKHLKCPHCDYTTALQNWLANHMKRHSNDTPFLCQYCSYTCKTPNRLRVHVRLHTGEKPYKCHICIYAAVEGAPLKKHLKSQHGLSIEKINIRQGKLYTADGEVIETGIGTTTNPIEERTTPNRSDISAADSDLYSNVPIISDEILQELNSSSVTAQ